MAWPMGRRARGLLPIPSQPLNTKKPRIKRARSCARWSGLRRWSEEMCMLLLLDNYDSFTYNLYQYLSELGAEVVVRRNDQIQLSEIEAMAPAGIVISPGPCTPHEAGICNEVILAFGQTTPLLGVCL